MAKQVRSNQPEQKQLVVNQIVQVSVDRTMKDVATLRSALRSAESIYYPNRTRLYDLYADVDLDGHLTGIFGKRISAVLNKEWKFVNKEGKAVDEVDDNFIQTNQFRRLLTGIMKSITWGVSGFEFEPGETIKFKEIPRKHIKPETQVIAINQSDYEGIAYEDISNIFVVGEEKEYGLFLKCAFYALVKKGDFSDWSQYVEIFGQPMRIAKYDAHDVKTKQELSGVLRDAGSSLALMIPKQADFELLDGKVSNGDGQLQERLKNACNNEMSVVVLGNTETTSNDNGGSNAKAKEQGKQQLDITKDDVVFVRNILNTPKFLQILASYGYQVEGCKFTVEKEIDVNELLIRSQVDSTIKNTGLPIADDYFYETYHIPKPDNYDELKAKAEEERIAKQQPPTHSPSERPGERPKKKKPAPGNMKLSAWKQFRHNLADFFDPAH